MRTRKQRVTTIGATLAVVMILATAVPALAWEQEGGTKNCGAFIGYTHARFNWDGWTRGPGDSVIIFWNYPANSGWHAQEDNGQYSGSWLGQGDPQLDFGQTYAGCRNFG